MTRVLVVDDEPQITRALVINLKARKYEVDTAPDGATALEVIDDANPDVVVIDYSMPGMDGIETAARIRARRAEQVMIMYTAYLQPEVEQRAREVGVALVLGKVEGLESLEREISRLCGTLF